MSMFTKAHSRMNRVISKRMRDTTGTFRSAEGQSVSGLQLMIDSNFELAGVMEVLTGNIKAVSVHRPQLGDLTPVRGDIFESCGKRYMIEDTLSDDSYFPVYACQELNQ